MKIEDMSLAEQLHAFGNAEMMIEQKIEEAFEEFEPEIAKDLEFTIGSDWYDNSVEIYIHNSLPYPYEPCKEIRKVIYDMGFSMVYWNFEEDKHKNFTEEIRGYEPRHLKGSENWISNKYGYVDNRFNEEHWVKHYKIK